MIKFVTGFSGFGGSTIMILQHCDLLLNSGISVEFYGPEDWHLDKFQGSRLISEFRASRDDVVIFHYFQPEIRPKCKKVFLYTQETNLFELKGRNLSCFDQILFVSEQQRKYHEFDFGTIVPNRISGLVDPLRNNPPRQNIAAVIGHVHPIKNTHISIENALKDNVSKIIIYGMLSIPYFEEKIKPFLSEKVVYGGLVPLELKMEMYNSFDVLYHFAEHESACITWAEAHVLGKKIVKSEKLYEYPILSDFEILEIWKSIIK